MSYRIDFDSSFENEIRRIASKQLVAAAELLEKQPDGPHEAIHDARKHIKQTRSLYRLIASCGKDFAAFENNRLRDIARQLSGMRDAAALVETAKYLQREAVSEKSSRMMGRVARELETRREAVAQTEASLAELGAVAASLREANGAVNGMQLPSTSTKAARCVASGWDRVGKRAQTALRACKDPADDDAFHSLRKRAQDRWMHAALVNQAWPTAMIAIQREAKSLADLLGHEHDLAVLHAHVASSDEENEHRDPKDKLLQAIRSQQQKLQHDCRDIGRQLFGKRKSSDAVPIRLLLEKR